MMFSNLSYWLIAKLSLLRQYCQVIWQDHSACFVLFLGKYFIFLQSETFLLCTRLLLLKMPCDKFIACRYVHTYIHTYLKCYSAQYT